MRIGLAYAALADKTARGGRVVVWGERRDSRPIGPDGSALIGLLFQRRLGEFCSGRCIRSLGPFSERRGFLARATAEGRHGAQQHGEDDGSNVFRRVHRNVQARESYGAAHRASIRGIEFERE